MTSKSVDDYFKDLVSAIERENVEDLVYARRDYLDIMPADPSFPVNSEERLKQTASIEKVVATFWDNENLQEDLKEFQNTNFPELQDWYKKLVTVSEHKTELLNALENFSNIPQTSQKFFRSFYISSERESAKMRKQYLLKLKNNKQLLKWHNKIIKELQKTTPEIVAIEDIDISTQKKFSSFSIFKSSAGDNSGNIGCFVLVIIWLLIRFIITVSS